MWVSTQIVVVVYRTVANKKRRTIKSYFEAACEKSLRREQTCPWRTTTPGIPVSKVSVGIDHNEDPINACIAGLLTKTYQSLASNSVDTLCFYSV